jgi:hypothetical protein
MRKGVLLYSLTFLFAFAGCRTEHPLPDCIKEKIQQLMQEPVRNPPAEVWQYDFEGKAVYFIPASCCDMYSELLYANCGVICAPDGGFTGRGDGKCPDFFSKRKNGILIWQDKR